MSNRDRKTQRMTVAQAVVRYLQVQYSERDGQARRLIPAMCGIFGHGNVAGLGQALQEVGGDLPYHQTLVGHPPSGGPQNCVRVESVRYLREWLAELDESRQAQVLVVWMGRSCIEKTEAR